MKSGKFKPSLLATTTTAAVTCTLSSLVALGAQAANQTSQTLYPPPTTTTSTTPPQTTFSSTIKQSTISPLSNISTTHDHDELYKTQLEQTSAAISDIWTDEVSQTKLLASLILFIITLLCGYLPVRILLNQNYVQYAMFAGGGVLMATAFCHLIPEAHDNFKLINGEFMSSGHSHSHNHNHNHSHNNTILINPFNGFVNHQNQSLAANISNSEIDHEHLSALAPSDQTNQQLNIPYLEITLCCGFFFMYLVEQLMVRFINNHSHGHAVCEQEDSNNTATIVGIRSNNPNQYNIPNSDTQSHQSLANVSGSNVNIGQATSVNLSSINSANTTTAIVCASDRNISFAGSSSSSNGAGRTANTEFYKFMRGLLIVSAFGAHSIFDGVAIGSQISVDKVWTIFLAISCHKLIIAAVVGLELFSATLESHLWTLVHLSIFSIMSPIGIILVVIAQESLRINSNHPTMILLQSFATGTLLYIVFVEILQPKESSTYEKNKFGKSLSLFAGFAVMVTVLVLIDE